MKYLYRLYQLLIALPLFVLSTLTTAFVTGVGCSVGLSRWFAFMPSRLWGRHVVSMFLLPITVEGREHLQKGQSYVFVANHQGAFDIYILSGFLGREFKWMMKKALRSIPFVGFACEKAGFIFVDKSNRRAVAQTMADARQRLQGGTSLVVFPEGSRTYTGRVGTFKRGAFQLADELQLPVVPITIDGSFEVLPRTRGFGFVTWHPLRLIIHPPISPQGQGEDNVKMTLEASHRAIISALPQHREEAQRG